MTQIHWANPISGSFTNASDWSGGVVPGANDAAILDAAGVKLYTVTVSATETVSSIQTAANATLYMTAAYDTFTAINGTGAGANAGTIAVSNGGTLAIGGVFDNSGALAVAGSQSYVPITLLSIEQQGVTLTGGGQVTVANDKGLSRMIGGSLTNVDNTISIASIVELGGLKNEQAGVIDATGSGYPSLASNTITNSGLIENTGTNALVISCSVFDQSGGGMLLAADGASIYLEGTLIGGTLKTAGKGFISSLDATFNGTTATVNNEGAVTVRGFDTLALEGAINNSGTISLNGRGGVGGRARARLTIDPGGVTLTGGGSVVLNSTGLNIVTGGASAATLTNLDNTISGAGALGSGSMGLVNDAAGVIDGNDALGLILDTGAGAVVNDGLIEGTGSGGLTIRDTSVDSSSGGVILAGNGSRVSLQGADLIGGTLESVGSGTIKTYKGGPNTLDGTASALDNQAKVVVQNGTALTLQGAIVNSGRFQLVGSSAATTLTIGSGSATLSGGGNVLMNDSARNVIVGATSAATLTNVDNVITGAGDLGDGSLTLVNDAKGVIAGSQAMALIVDTGANAIVNAGVILARGAGGVTIQSAVASSGLLEADGGTLTVNGAVTGTGSAMIYSGTLDFTSSFSQNVVFQKTTGQLELTQSQSYAGTVSGFSKTGGTSLDLRDIGFVSSTEATFSGTASGGILTVTDGTHTAHIALRGDYTASTFTASSDGHGGTIVVDPTAPAAATHRFIAAAASFGAVGGGLMSPTHETWRAHPPTLAKPAVMKA